MQLRIGFIHLHYFFVQVFLRLSYSRYDHNFIRFSYASSFGLLLPKLNCLADEVLQTHIVIYIVECSVSTGCSLVAIIKLCLRSLLGVLRLQCTFITVEDRNRPSLVVTPTSNSIRKQNIIAIFGYTLHVNSGTSCSSASTSASTL